MQTEEALQPPEAEIIDPARIVPVKLPDHFQENLLDLPEQLYSYRHADGGRYTSHKWNEEIDRPHFLQTIERYLEEDDNPLFDVFRNQDTEQINLEKVLQLTTKIIWRSVGEHRDNLSDLLDKRDVKSYVGLMDMDTRPETKCVMFSEAFERLYETIAQKFQREDILKKHKLLQTSAYVSADVRRTNRRQINHQFLTIVSNSPNGLLITPIDPYHITREPKQRKDGQIIERDNINHSLYIDSVIHSAPEFQILDMDQSANRFGDSYLAFLDSIGIQPNTSPLIHAEKILEVSFNIPLEQQINLASVLMQSRQSTYRSLGMDSHVGLTHFGRMNDEEIKNLNLEEKITQGKEILQIKIKEEEEKVQQRIAEKLNRIEQLTASMERLGDTLPDFVASYQKEIENERASISRIENEGISGSTSYKFLSKIESGEKVLSQLDVRIQQILQDQINSIEQSTDSNRIRNIQDLVTLIDDASFYKITLDPVYMDQVTNFMQENIELFSVDIEGETDILREADFENYVNFRNRGTDDVIEWEGYKPEDEEFDFYTTFKAQHLHLLTLLYTEYWMDSLPQVFDAVNIEVLNKTVEFLRKDKNADQFEDIVSDIQKLIEERVQN